MSNKQDGIYLLDTSGRMGPAAFTAAHDVVEKTYKSYDRTALIGFDYRARVIIPMYRNILKWPEDLRGEGWSCILAALKMAQEINSNAQLHVIGDGAMPQSNYAEMQKLGAIMHVVGAPAFEWTRQMVSKYSLSCTFP